MKHYYDIYSLLHRSEVQAFIGTADYQAHKTKRFRGGDNPNIAQNQAFFLADPETRKIHAEAFAESSALYYGDKPTFEQIQRDRQMDRSAADLPAFKVHPTCLAPRQTSSK